MLRWKPIFRTVVTTAVLSSLIFGGVATAQNRNNDFYQQQQRQQQQDQQRQQQQAQMRQQQQDQMRQQMQQQMRQQQQDQMRQQMQQQMRQQQQDQMRQQTQQQARQQQDQMRQQAQQQARQQQQSQMQQQVRQQQANQTKQQMAEQQRQLQNAQRAQASGKPAPAGVSQANANKAADRMVFSNGVAKLTRPLTAAEMKRGFTGKVTDDGRALVKFQNRIFAVPASRIGITPRRTETSQAALATRWTSQQQASIRNDIKNITAGSTSTSNIANQRPPSSRDDLSSLHIKDRLNKAKLERGESEFVYRWMSRQELQATQETGLLRGGRDGTHYVTDAANSDPKRARQRTALPQTPEVLVKMEVPKGVFSEPSKVKPDFNMPGGGNERTANGKVPVRVISTEE